MKKPFDFETTTKFKTPEESPGYLLWRVSMQWRSKIEEVLRPLQLTHPQFVILACLGWLTKKGAAVSQAEIARSAGLDPNTTSQILRGLEAKKFIKRTHLADERSKNPVLTQQGSDLLAQALPTVETADASYFSSLSSKESGMLLSVFQLLLTKKS